MPKDSMRRTSEKLRQTPGLPPPPSSPPESVPVALRLALVGAGQGGGRLVQAFWELGYRRALAVNTTEADFGMLPPELERLSLKTGGAAKNREAAKQAFQHNEERIRAALLRSWNPVQEVDWVLACATLGGGTGSGMIAPLLKLCQQLMADQGRPVKVGAVVSLPSQNEGAQTKANAWAAFQELMALRPCPLIVVDNQRIHQIYRPPVLRLHQTANQSVASLVHELNRCAAITDAVFTLDSAELKHLFGSGLVLLGKVVLSEEQLRSPADLSEAISNELDNMILVPGDLGTGQVAVCVFTAPSSVLDRVEMDLFDAGYTRFDRMVGSKRKEPAVVHRGLCMVGDDQPVSFVFGVGGVDVPEQRLASLAVAGANPSSMATFLGVSD